MNRYESLTIYVEFVRLKHLFEEWGVDLPPLAGTPRCSIMVFRGENCYYFYDDDAKTVWEYIVNYGEQDGRWCYITRHMGYGNGCFWTDPEITYIS